MRIDESRREEARDWLVTGQEARFDEWMTSFSVTERHADPDLLLLEGEWYRHERRYPEATFCLEKAADLFATHDDSQGCFAVFVDLMGVAWDRQDLDAFARWSRRAEVLLSHATLLDQAEYFNNLACHELALGRSTEAESLWRRVLNLPRFGSLHIASIQQFATLNLGVVAMERTEVDEAARRFRQVLTLAERHPLRPSARFGAMLYLARLSYIRGDFSGAREGLATLPEAPDSYRSAEAALLEADLELAEDHLSLAEAALQRAIAHFDSLNVETADLGLALGMLGFVRGRQGARGQALDLHERAISHTKGWPQYLAAVHLYRAEISEVPNVELELAWKLARQAGSRYYSAWAGFKLGGGHADEATALVEQVGCYGIRRLPWMHGVSKAEIEETSPALFLSALGELEVRLNGDRLANWSRRKAPVLLMALAFARDGRAREDLAELLFPDHGPAEAEHQLDNLSSVLRKLLEPTLGRKAASRFIEVKDRRYRLVEGSWTADFEEFGREIAKAERARREGDRAEWEAIAARALSLYRGDLLSDPFYEPWFEAERQYYRQLFLRVGLALADDLVASGREAEAQDLWERLLVVDSTCLEAHGGLIRLFEAHGRQSLAEAQRSRQNLAFKTLGLV
jgi:DNA-binding SARP family transcriptional activator